MICKVLERREKAVGTVCYVADAGPYRTGLKRPDIIGGTVSSRNVKQVIDELMIPCSIRQTVKKPISVFSLSLHPDDGRIARAKWQDIVKDFMHGMGFPDDIVYIAIRHRDKPHDHVHIIANRISLSGKLYYGRNEVKRAIGITRGLEKKYHLKEVKNAGKGKSDNFMPQGEYAGMRYRGKIPVRVEMRQAIQGILKAANKVINIKEFELELRDKGISFIPSKTESGKIFGCSFECKGVRIKGSDLGRSYSWNSLVKSLDLNEDIEKTNEENNTVPQPDIGISISKSPLQNGELDLEKEKWLRSISLVGYLKKKHQYKSKDRSNSHYSGYVDGKLLIATKFSSSYRITYDIKSIGGNFDLIMQLENKTLDEAKLTLWNYYKDVYENKRNKSIPRKHQEKETPGKNFLS